MQFCNIDFGNFETLNFEKFETKVFLFSNKGIPSTPQHTDFHPCTRPPFLDTLVTLLGDTIDFPGMCELIDSSERPCRETIEFSCIWGVWIAHRFLVLVGSLACVAAVEPQPETMGEKVVDWQFHARTNEHAHSLGSPWRLFNRIRTVSRTKRTYSCTL